MGIVGGTGPPRGVFYSRCLFGLPSSSLRSPGGAPMAASRRALGVVHFPALCFRNERQ